MVEQDTTKKDVKPEDKAVDPIDEYTGPFKRYK